MIITAVSEFGEIKSIKIQLIGMWQKAVMEKFDHSALECNASVASLFEPSRTFKKIASNGHHLQLAKLYKKKDVPISCLTVFDDKFWAQVVSLSGLFDGFCFSFGSSSSLPHSGASGSNIGSSFALYNNSSLNAHLATLEHSLELLMDWVSGILKKLSGMELVLMATPSSVPPLATSPSLVPHLDVDMAVNNMSLASAFPLSAVDNVVLGSSSSFFKVLTSKVGRLESKMVAFEVLIGSVLESSSSISISSLMWKVATYNVRNMNNSAKQEDITNKINFLIARAINKSSLVILGGNFNKDGSHKCVSFKKYHDLGLVNSLGGSSFAKVPTWNNSRDVAKTINYVFVSSNLVNAIIQHNVFIVSEHFDMKLGTQLTNQLHYHGISVHYTKNSILKPSDTTNVPVIPVLAVSVSLGLGGFLDVRLNSLHKQANKNRWKFNFKNANEIKWNNFKSSTLANATMFLGKFTVFMRFLDLNLLVSKIVKALCGENAGNFVYLMKYWSSVDDVKSSVVQNLVDSGADSDHICSALFGAKKSYRCIILQRTSTNKHYPKVAESENIGANHLGFAKSLFQHYCQHLRLNHNYISAKSAFNFYVNEKIFSLLGTPVNTESAKKTFYRELIQNTNLPTNHNFASIITEINKEIEHHIQQRYPITYANKGKGKLQTLVVIPKRIQPPTWKKTRVESPTAPSYYYTLGSTINITSVSAFTSNAISTFRQFSFQSKQKKTDLLGPYGIQSLPLQPDFRATTLWELSEEEEEGKNPENATPNIQTLQNPEQINPNNLPSNISLQPPNLDPMAYAPIVKLDNFTSEEDDTQVWLNNVEKAIAQGETEAVTTYLKHFYRNLYQIQAIDANYFTAPQIFNQFIREDVIFSNLELDQQTTLTNNIPPATVTNDESLAAIFPFELEESSQLPLFSGATLEEKPITAMYTNAKVDRHLIKLILDSGSTTQELQLSVNGQHTCVPAMCGHFKIPSRKELLIELEEEKKPIWEAFQVSWADADHNELLLILLWNDKEKKKKKELTWKPNLGAWGKEKEDDQPQSTNSAHISYSTPPQTKYHQPKLVCVSCVRTKNGQQQLNTTDGTLCLACGDTLFDKGMWKDILGRGRACDKTCQYMILINNWVRKRTPIDDA
ncbi:hypothetical protein G9A89_016225 [Geosiphon pyriformis]|nr:hypothetical protein G9A89_016225 [Geosiphon pyriformis]